MRPLNDKRKIHKITSIVEKKTIRRETELIIN